MRYITPVTDRSAEDITGLTSKAFFNVVDWERIRQNEQVVQVLVDFLRNRVTSLDPVTGVTTATIPTVGQLNTLLSNINKIIVTADLPDTYGISAITDTWQSGTVADSPDYVDVNLWERTLDLIYNSIGGIVDAVRTNCGVATTGQAAFYQHRWRQFHWVLPAAAHARWPRLGYSFCGSSLTYNSAFRRYA